MKYTVDANGQTSDRREISEKSITMFHGRLPEHMALIYF